MRNRINIHTVSDNLYFLKILWKINPRRVIFSFAAQIFGYAEWAFFSVVFMKYLFGAAEFGRSFGETAWFIAVSMAVIFLTTGFQIWMEERYVPCTDPELYEKLNGMLFEQASNVDIACYEDVEFYDTYTKAASQAYERARSVLTDTAGMIAAFFASAYVVVTLFTIHWIAGLFSFLPMIGNFLFSKVINRIEYEKKLEGTPYVRRQNYVNRVLYLSRYAKEIRMTKIKNVLDDTYEEAYGNLIAITAKYWKRLCALGLMRGVLCFPLVFEGMWLFAAYCAMVTKSILIGDFVVLANAIVSTTWMLTDLAGNIAGTYQNGLYAKTLKEFMSYEAKIPEDSDGIPVPERVETLELRDVSFRYPSREMEKKLSTEGKYALRHVNYTFAAGKNTALVGYNGSGKSTLVKLLMRLYDPTEGAVLLNGVDIRRFNLQAYRRLIGTTFQDFELFSMSVLENVIMEKLETEAQRAAAMEALQKSGVLEQVMQLEKGADSILTREFDDRGVVLSGGQAQKIAVAQVLPNYVETKLKPVSREKIHRRIWGELYRKAAEIDLKNYDDPEFYNEFVWAMGEAANRVEAVIGSCAALIGETAGICVVSGYVLSQDRFGLLLTGISVVILLFLTNLYNRRRMKLREKIRHLERKLDYISRVFYLPEYAKELRLNRIKPRLYEEFHEASGQIREITGRETRRLQILKMGIRYGSNTLLIEGVYLTYLLFQTIVKGAFGYGTAVTLYNSCGNLKTCSRGLAEVLTEIPEHGRYIEKIRHFLDYPVEICYREDAQAVADELNELNLEHVSFSYPGGTPVLKDVSLTIKRGERIALVGYNGAGKTTLVKLLMRLYDVTAGKITRNGTDVRDLKLGEYRGQFATLFQDYQLFAATLGQNIVMDRVPIEEGKAEPLLRKSGFDKKFAGLPKGYDTPLTREFEEDGMSFSGGEAQMAGICRSLYQDAPVIVLDEPSSALDPLSEYNLNHTMMTLGRDKTVIFISHRLSTTRLADRIYMFEEGRIVEEGTHEELMGLDGKYAAMFRLQMEKYR